MKNIESFENFNEKKNWIKDAIKKPGSLRSAAKRRGLIKGDETLSKTDLNKLSKVKGKTGKRANLARTLKSMNESISTKNTSSNKEIMDKVAIFEKWGYDDSYDFLSRHQS